LPPRPAGRPGPGSRMTGCRRGSPSPRPGCARESRGRRSPAATDRGPRAVFRFPARARRAETDGLQRPLAGSTEQLRAGAPPNWQVAPPSSRRTLPSQLVPSIACDVHRWQSTAWAVTRPQRPSRHVPRARRRVEGNGEIPTTLAGIPDRGGHGQGGHGRAWPARLPGCWQTRSSRWAAPGPPDLGQAQPGLGTMPSGLLL
jgi:hypothetical protein